MSQAIYRRKRNKKTSSTRLLFMILITLVMLSFPWWVDYFINFIAKLGDRLLMVVNN
jgi:hypothetical protein